MAESDLVGVGESHADDQIGVGEQQHGRGGCVGALDPTDSPAFVITAMPVAHAVLAPSVDRDDVVVEVADPPSNHGRRHPGEVGANVDAGRGTQPVELCSLGLDRQLVAFELLNSLGEQTVLRLEIVIVKDGVPRIGERRDDCARHLGDRVQKVANKPLRCPERAEAAEI